MSQIPRPLRSYILSLLPLFPVNTFLYWLDVSMGTWYIVMGLIAVFGAGATFYETICYLRPDLVAATLPSATRRADVLDRHPQPAPRSPIDLTPHEFRQPVTPDPDPDDPAADPDDFDPSPEATYPRTPRPSHTTTFPRTLSL